MRNFDTIQRMFWAKPEERGENFLQDLIAELSNLGMGVEILTSPWENREYTHVNETTMYIVNVREYEVQVLGEWRWQVWGWKDLITESGTNLVDTVAKAVDYAVRLVWEREQEA